MKPVTYNHLVLPAAAIVLLLSGCVSRDFGDLEQWTQQVLARPGGRIDPLPEIKPYEAYEFQAAKLGKRDPFQPFYRQRQQDTARLDDPDAGLTKEMIREIRNRNREELEKFELDSLRMVGTIVDANETWGIIADPDGVVHRIRIGNYMGRNIGKIVNIFEDRVEMREIVKNEQGRWEERAAAIALVEDQ